MQKPKYGQRGFTLLELMVVITIIGVIVGVASLSIGQSSSRQIEEEVLRFTRLVELASEEAMLKSQVLAIELEESAYRFYIHDGSEWLVVEGDELFRERKLAASMVFELEVEGEDVDLDDEEQQPKLVFLPSGEMTPFKLRCYISVDPDGDSFFVEGNMLGKMKLGMVNKEL